MLLLLAGVPEQDAAVDYEITYTYLKGKYRGDADITHSAYRADAKFLEPLFARVRESGGADAFLKGLGVSAAALKALRARLLD
jgi:hypothetical protein